jgi:large subunit ribosomal protein L21
MAFAIIRTGGKQFRVEKGAKVRVPSINGEVGASVDLDVLAATDGDSTKVGAPLVDGAKVTATVVDHGREPKIIVFKKKRRKQYKRTKGHRQGYTTLKIDSIG